MPVATALPRRWLAALTVGLLALVLYRGIAILTSDPLLALANNYDMIRVQACVKAYPVRAPGIAAWAGSGDAPIERYRFRDDVGAPCFLSSEVLFARLARPLFKAESLRSGDGTFSVRWLGTVKFAAFFALAVGLSAAWWRRGQQAAATANAAVAAVVLTDPAITLYLSGFYAEYSSVLFGYAAIAGAALLMGGRKPPGAVALALLALVVTGFVTSKIQHIGLGLLLALAIALPALAAGRTGRRVVLAVAAGGALGLAIQAYNLAKTENEIMRLANLTSTVLTTLLPLSDDPDRTAQSIGLPRRCGRYAGLNWYLPPVNENAANHPCREVAEVSHARLLGLAFFEPKLFMRFVGGSLAHVRPWIPSRYRGKPHLGVVAGRMQASLPDGWFSWSRVLDRLPLWTIQALVAAPALVMAILLGLRRLREPSLAAVLTALAVLPHAVIVTVTFGNGYEDAAKQMHLVFAMVLGFWLLLALAVLGRAGGTRAAGGALPAGQPLPPALPPAAFAMANRSCSAFVATVREKWRRMFSTPAADSCCHSGSSRYTRSMASANCSASAAIITSCPGTRCMPSTAAGVATTGTP
jgi:hypothetical protein